MKEVENLKKSTFIIKEILDAIKDHMLLVKINNISIRVDFPLMSVPVLALSLLLSVHL